MVRKSTKNFQNYAQVTYFLLIFYFSQIYVKGLCLFPYSFQLIGAAILSVGIYAEVSKWDYEGVTNVLLSPSSVMIAIGGFMFILNFLGWIGALRENVTLLKIVSMSKCICWQKFKIILLRTDVLLFYIVVWFSELHTRRDFSSFNKSSCKYRNHKQK